jgi:(p)ppGpp synthase/HD superfamily hydrolase
MDNLGLDLLEKAIGIAVAAHRGQKDRYGAPYILHPLRVMGRVVSTEGKTVAILHDVVEDTDWTFERLEREGFPRSILDALERVTRREDESYAEFVQRSAGSELSRQVKIADLEDNLDARRMTEVKPEDAERLERYRRAWRDLTGAGSR